MKLHPLPNDGRFFCGPAAIAAFTGEHPKGRIREEINRQRGRELTQGVCYMQTFEVRRVIFRFGFRSTVEQTSRPKPPTVKEVARAYTCSSMILRTHNHFVACSEGMLMDNHSRWPRPAEMFDGNRARVKEIIFLERVPMQ